MSRAAFVLLVVLSCPLLLARATPLTTEAERSDFRRTGRYEEVERLCAAAAAADARRVRCFTFGRTPEGRNMLALAVSQDGTLDAAKARRRQRPVILVQGGIHAGEIEGKDAILWSLRELLAGQMAKGVLDAATIVFVPVFNVDGHERFGPANRPNQRGPEEMGYRTTSQNLNLNRDYVKADAPEMRAMLALFEEFDPVLYVDLHTTDGAKFEHDVSVEVAPTNSRPDGLDRVAAKLSDEIQARLTANNHLPLDFYPDFRKPDDPTSGFEADDSPPRFSQSYAAARNRLGILVETHSWKTYRERATATHDVLAAIFERAVSDGRAWLTAARDADEKGRRLGGTDVALSFVSDGTSRTVDFRGYEYRVSRSEISGKDWISYDETKPQVWHVPLFNRVKPKLTVRAPQGGYVVPLPHAAWVAEKLRVHGVRYVVVPKATAKVAAQAFHIDDITYEKPFEGHLPIKVTGAWRPVQRDVPAGALFVPIDQPRGLLVLHLLEPEGPDSLVSWGFFNGIFERKEYMEPYVLEEEARKMLAKDPALKTDFERRLREDPAFAASPEQRLEFFYRRHPAWNDGHEWVPVLRVDSAGVLGSLGHR
jgi:hypothetical protein